LAAGCVEFMRKPIDFQGLREAIGRHLSSN
jgi:FixJ family two-component response regulator